MPTSAKVECTKCDFEETLIFRPIVLRYRIPGFGSIDRARSSGWCHKCGTIRDLEPSFAVETLANLLENHYKTRSKTKKYWRCVVKLLGANEDSYEKEEKEYQELLRVARSRKSKERCIVCESQDTDVLSFDEDGVSKCRHSCGGHLRLMEPEEDAPRFFFRTEVIELDTEGFCLRSYS